MSAQSYTVGTGPDCDVILADEYASRLHAHVWRDERGRIWVEDLGSTNGTWVNGLRILDARIIYPGDTLRIGRTDIPWRT